MALGVQRRQTGRNKTQNFPRKKNNKMGEPPAIKKQRETTTKKTGAHSAFLTGPSYHLGASELASGARDLQGEIEEHLAPRLG
jgi:hypothetical protein